MVRLDWEHKRTQKLKVRNQQVRRAPDKPAADYNWENPAANNRVPYVWENPGLVHNDKLQAQLHNLSQPRSDGYNPLRIFFNIFGRLNRASYVKRWVAVLLIASIPIAIFGKEPSYSQLTLRSDFSLNIALGISLVLYLALKALQIRRLHDLGLSSFWVIVTIAVDAGLVLASGGLWYLCVVAAVIYNFIFVYFYGTFGPNKYGPDPILSGLGDGDPFAASGSNGYKQILYADVIRLTVLLFFRFMVLLFSGY